jgi:hypothetical protein
MNFALNAKCRITSDRYNWIVSVARGDEWRDVLFYRELRDACRAAVRDKLATAADVAPLQPLLDRIAALEARLLASAADAERAAGQSPGTIEFSGGWRVRVDVLKSRGAEFYLKKSEADFGFFMTFVAAVQAMLHYRLRLAERPEIPPELVADIESAATLAQKDASSRGL